MSLQEYKARRARLGFSVAPKPVPRLLETVEEPATTAAPRNFANDNTGYELAELVCEMEEVERRPILMGYIKQRTAAKFGITVADIEGRSRKSHIIWARHIAIWLCVQYAAQTGSNISRHFNRDHVTGIYAVDHVEGRPYRRGNRWYRVVA